MVDVRSGRDLNGTPTWAVALVSAFIILISVLLEKVLHRIGTTFEKRRKKALREALEKIKAELMVLGFISLLLTFGQNYIARICIPEEYANTMLPCPLSPSLQQHSPPKGDNEHHRQLLWHERRILVSDLSVHCKEGYVPFISVNALHQLHLFIFFLAICHVVFGAVTMTLGRAKIRKWKEWEKGVADAHELSSDSSRYRLTRDTSFVKNHTGFMLRTPILFYIVCFYKQFFMSVRKADYLTMRNGFVSVHFAPGSKFNFQKYIKRSLEDDFKIVVGISPVLWISAVIFLLLNVNGWKIMFWLSVMPLVSILVIGTKLQAIIAQMAVEIQERHAVIQGIPLVQVSDKHFWFGSPRLVLHVLHLTLFQNAFEITYFVWLTYEFGFSSCFRESTTIGIVRVAIGLAVQILCSYITLPLYALVTQMGSTMKQSIFDEQTSKALKNWTKNARKKTGKSGSNHNRTSGGSSKGSIENPPVRPNPTNAGPEGMDMVRVDIPPEGMDMARADIPPEGMHMAIVDIPPSNTTPN